jgi:hypothetical protein
MNVLRIQFRAVTFATVFLVSLGTAAAQPVSSNASSVEWVAANASLIVRGIIEDISMHALPDGLAGGGGKYHHYQTLSVRVLETLKGEHSDRLQFVNDGDFGSFRLIDLQKNKQEVLLFLEPWIRKFDRSTGGYAYTRFPLVARDVAILTSQDVRWINTSLPVLSANLTRLSTPRQLADTIKSYLKNRNPQAPLQATTILLPPELRAGFYEVRFTFPTDADFGERTVDGIPKKNPVLAFEDFRKQFAKKPPAEEKPSYSRKRGGYVGVYALELMAADCDAIVRGVIEDHLFVSRTDDPTGDLHGVYMRVTETIKGKTAKEITCFVTDAGDLDRLQRNQEELVVFLRDNHNGVIPYPAGALEYRTRSGLWDDSAIILNKNSAEVLFADLTWRRNPEEIIARLRAAAQRAEKIEDIEDPEVESVQQRLPVFSVHPPTSVAVGSSIAGNPYSVVFLPVNQELEASAWKWAQSSDPDLRWLGARAIIYFRSEKNAILLKGMLDDVATWERGDMLRMTGLSYPFEPKFLVRWEAFHVLAGWGYDDTQPLFK